MSDTPIYDQLLNERYPLLLVPMLELDDSPAIVRFREQMGRVRDATRQLFIYPGPPEVTT